MLKCRSNTEITWESVVVRICEDLYLAEEMAWIKIDDFWSMIVVSSESEAQNLKD